MATNKNIIMKQYNGTDYDNLYPATTAGQLQGTVPVSKGGTGATTASEALSNIGAASASHTHGVGDITSGVLPVARGGTGQSTVNVAVGTDAFRQMRAGTDDMTAGSSDLATGTIYLVYEA